MAYASPSRGSRGGSSYSRGGGGGGGSTNAVAYAFAIIIVVGVVVLVIAMSGGKKPETAKPQPAPAPTVAPPVLKPAPSGEKPYPAMPAAKIEAARNLVDTFAEDASKADGLYAESLRAKKSGNDAEWQSKLKEAHYLLDSINTRWNEFIATLPSSADYNTEDVAMHYFKKEMGRVTKLTANLKNMKAEER